MVRLGCLSSALCFHFEILSANDAYLYSIPPTWGDMRE